MSSVFLTCRRRGPQPVNRMERLAYKIPQRPKTDSSAASRQGAEIVAAHLALVP